MNTDTIAAIATGMTESGIGIIRISGPDAVEIADKLYRNKNKKLADQKSHTLHYGMIYEEENPLDEVLVSIMIAPCSYTGETTVEINCHGGIYVLNKILSLVLKNGARLAEPGEFTKRAFLNGKFDLSKAEAVMDLISSKNEFAMKNSIKQLKGNIYDEIKKMREEIIYEIAYIESAIDDPEHFDLTGYPVTLMKKTDTFIKKIDQLIRNSKNGKIRKDGISTVILGKPNAGKSSFLNVLAGEERAIVTDMAGTTRDILEENIRIDDIVLQIVDTAGIRNTEDKVEKIGVEKARKYATDADLILYMVDSSIALDENDFEIIDFIKDKKVIVLLNKSDLEVITDETSIKDNFFEEVPVIRISAKELIGIDEFTKVLKKMFFEGSINLNEDIIITNLRQIKELEEAKESLVLVQKSIDDFMPEDFFYIDLKNAYIHLGYIIGEEMDDDVVNEIFSKFCMGK